MPLPGPTLPPSFDKTSALALTKDLVEKYPDRGPGSPGALGASRWFADQLKAYGFPSTTDGFFATIPGRGRVLLRNILAVARGPSTDAIVVMAHRDDTGAGTGANDNASGTAALIELARAYGQPATAAGKPVRPQHTLLFLSTDGGEFGALGATRFAQSSPYRGHVLAVINLDALAGPGRARLEIGGDQPRSPAAALVETAAARIAEENGSVAPGRTSAFGQLIDLAFPFSLYEQAPFVGRGVPAVTLTTAGDRPPDSAADRPLNGTHLLELGRAAQNLVTSIDTGLELPQGTSTYLYLGQRFVRGWAVELALIAMLLPFLVPAIDLFARCRRRRIAIAPALRSYRSRLGFWLWCGILFFWLDLLGVWPGGAARPINPETAAAGNWPRLGLLALAILAGLSWLVPRARLTPRRPVTPEEDLAGHVAALLALAVVALLVVATNPFALIFLLPSLHAWLWLPQLRVRGPVVTIVVLLAGFAGPLFLLGSLAVRFGLGLDSPWYLAELTAIGYVPIVAVFIFLAWTATAAQLIVLAAGRYAPYPSAEERPPRGPIRNAVRAVLLVIYSRRRAAPDTEQRALEQ